jgi:hypothetical protein
MVEPQVAKGAGRLYAGTLWVGGDVLNRLYQQLAVAPSSFQSETIAARRSPTE